jgi:hypothetical protein
LAAVEGWMLGGINLFVKVAVDGEATSYGAGHVGGSVPGENSSNFGRVNNREEK